MFLTRANVLHYLVDKQFAEIESVVSGTFVVRPLTRRNLNFRVTCGTREYLVKQAKSWDCESRKTVEAEAAFYRHEEAGKRLAHLVPQCHSYDPPNSILIFEYLAGYTDLNAAPDRFAPEVARLCGETMGTFHREMESSALATKFPGNVPWFLSFLERARDMPAPSAGRREVVRAVQKYPEFGRALDELRGDWRDDTLTHGDWRLENCLIAPQRDRLRMVDWEFVSWGDSIWDVSALLQSYLNFWVYWPAEHPIEALRPALRSFLNAYAQARARDPSELAARAIRFVGAHMLRTAFDALEQAEEMTGEALSLLQASLNIVTRPDWAVEQWIGPPLA